jgi:putative toxin-antitoxin system antitoxin component (TIGR02293 family)
MAAAMERAKNVMAALLAEAEAGIKGLSQRFALCAICAYIDGQLAKGRFMATSARAVKQEHQLTVSLDKVDQLRQWGFSNEEIHQIVGPRRSLDRRRAQGGVLSLIESDRVFRLEQIAEHADRVFGNHEKAQRWLRKPNRALDMVRPIDLLVSEAGAHQVHEILHRIDFGMFS